MSKTRTVREFTVEQIARDFMLGSYWFGATWCPAVDNDKHTGGYQIRVLVSVSHNGANTNRKWDYFYTSADGTITTAPRGYAKDYKPGRITGLDEAVELYAEPDPAALRLRFGGL